MVISPPYMDTQEMIHQEERKMAAIRILAIIGFIVTVIFAAWLAVQAVRLLPAAFNMLASLAENTERLPSEQTEQRRFVVSPDERVVRSGEPVTISWTQMSADGAYLFAYQCDDDAHGVSAEISTHDDTYEVLCGEELVLPEMSDSLTATFLSDELPAVTITYAVRFAPHDGNEPSQSGGRISVTNTGVREDEPDPAYEEAADEPDEVSEPLPTYYRTVPVVTTTYPVSDPSGYADLQATFIAVGAYDAYANAFVPHTSLRAGDRSAIRFEVKNVGTKTSSAWHFTADLPTDPSYTYLASSQAALRPNERQIITLQFDASDHGAQTMRVNVSGGDDHRTNNNSFSQRVDVR